MKLSRKQLRMILLKEVLLKEAPPGIIGGPGMGGGTAPAEIEGERVKPREQAQSEYMADQIPDAIKSLAPMLAEILIGFTPAGVAVDAKDLTVAVKDIITGDVSEGEAYANLGFATLGFLPFGDVFKGVKKAFLKVPEEQISDVIHQSYKSAASSNKHIGYSEGKFKNLAPTPTGSVKQRAIPTLDELNSVMNRVPNPTDSRILSLSVQRASQAAGRKLDRTNAVADIKPFTKIDGREQVIVTDALGNKRLFYKSTGDSGTGHADMWLEIEGFGSYPVQPHLYDKNQVYLGPNPNYRPGGQHGQMGWFVKTHQGKSPPDGTLDKLISDQLGDIDAAGRMPKPEGPELFTNSDPPDRFGDWPTAMAGINNRLKSNGVSTFRADTMLRQHVRGALDTDVTDELYKISGEVTYESRKIKVSRSKLRLLIENAILKEANKNLETVRSLNTFISDAKQREKESRAASEEFYYEHPPDDWNYIELLITSLGFDINPPRELSIHNVVEAEDGEVLASYLTYDQAVEFGFREGMIPLDGFDGKPVSMPVVSDGRNIYFTYAN